MEPFFNIEMVVSGAKIKVKLIDPASPGTAVEYSYNPKDVDLNYNADNTIDVGLTQKRGFNYMRKGVPIAYIKLNTVQISSKGVYDTQHTVLFLNAGGSALSTVIKNSAFWSDGTVSGTQLTDKSGNNRHGVISANLIADGDAELGTVMALYSAPVTLNENTATDFHSGTKSFHCITNGVNSGIITPYRYTTVAGETYNYSFWFKKISGSPSLIIFGGTSGQRVNIPIVGTTNTWVQKTGSYVETVGGSNAFMSFVGGTGAIEFYLDDIVLSESTGTVNGIKMANDSTLKAIDTTNYWFSATGIPLIKRTDQTTLFSANDKIFHGTGNKVIIKSGLTTGYELYTIINWFGGSANLIDYFTVERTILTPDPLKHFAFGGLIWVGNRMYCFYREGRSHQSYDGVLKSVFSNDKGATWSSPVLIYDASEISVPGEVTDVRDIKPIWLPNGTIGLMGFIAIGHNLTAYPDINCDDRVDASTRSFCISIPVIGTDLDLPNKVFSYIWNSGTIAEVSGGYAVKGNDIYAVVDSTTSPAGTYCHKSSNNGLTWSRISASIFNSVECALAFSGEVLYAVARTTGNNSTTLVSKSLDYGVTWQTPVSIAHNWGGPFAMPLNDGKIIVYGRNSLGVYIDIQKLSDTALSGSAVNIKTYTTSDCAYGNITKLNGIYFFNYHNGPLKSAPNKYLQSYAGMYFKEVYGTKIETF